jgi:ankyrin repeat protein
MQEGRKGRIIAAARRLAIAGLATLGLSMTMSATMPDHAEAKELRQAAQQGDTAAVTQLLASGSAIDARDEAGQTALLLAVAGNHVAIAKVLMEAGADINAQAANKDTPWLLAGARGRAEIIALMLPRKPDLSIRNRFGGDALIPACERGHVEAARLLVTSGIDVNHVNNLGWTCLLEIVILGDGGPRHREVTRLVLAAGANANIADKDGVTPLAHARRKGQDEIARMIEAAGGR